MLLWPRTALAMADKARGCALNMKTNEIPRRGEGSGQDSKSIVCIYVELLLWLSMEHVLGKRSRCQGGEDAAASPEGCKDV